MFLWPARLVDVQILLSRTEYVKCVLDDVESKSHLLVIPNPARRVQRQRYSKTRQKKQSASFIVSESSAISIVLIEMKFGSTRTSHSWSSNQIEQLVEKSLGQ